ncbi:MAG: class I SAM-dependent methyltransferase [Pseudomonadales bacterium]|nr:class I SAM-dependent methyltransferase [Pseudomonadales bacterium]MCP5183037.1 class I SAM-dependent methyltransferase [Pseudomonadales bacterium]
MNAPRHHTDSHRENDPAYDVLIRERFDQAGVASDYVGRKNHQQTWKNRRELACIDAALDGIANDSLVLDLPTGTGRLIPMLLTRGYRVIAADYSTHMLGQAEQYAASLPIAGRERVSFQREDVMAISLPDRSVDVAIANRLFHHYPTPALRRRALGELARVSRQRVVVSYFSNVALSALRFHLLNRLRGRTPTDRVPIWPREFAADVEAAGLRIVRTHAVRPGLSPQTYLVLRHQR